MAARMRNGYRLLAQNPEGPGQPPVEVTIPADLYTTWYKESSVDYYNLEVAKEVLEHPERVFERPRHYEQGGFCYVARPKEWYVRPRCRAPLPPRTVFAVYVNPNMRLYEIRLEWAADDDPANPRNWQERYGGLLWRSTS